MQQDRPHKYFSVTIPNGLRIYFQSVGAIKEKEKGKVIEDFFFQ